MGRSRSLVASVFSLLLVLALPSLAWAADFRADEGRQEVGGAVDDDLYIAGDEIVVSADVTGDVFAAGRNVRLSGSTGQSFFAGAQKVNIAGRVGHSARVGAQEVVVSGSINKDLLGGGQTVTIEPDGTVGRDIVAGGQELNIAGNVAGNVLGGTAQLTISGTVGGNVEVKSDGVTVADGARIGGDLVYTSDNEADIDPGAVVSGRVIRREPRAEPQAEDNPVIDALKELLSGVAGAFVLGLILLLLVPDLLPVLARTMRTAPLPSLGIGFAAFFMVPVVALMIFVPAVIFGTFGSLPVFLLGVYAFLLLMARAAAGYLVGLIILRRSADPAVPPTFADSLKALALGVTLLTVVGLIPFLGGMVDFVEAILVLGAGIVAFFRWRKARAAAFAPPAPPMPAGSLGA